MKNIYFSPHSPYVLIHHCKTFGQYFSMLTEILKSCLLIHDDFYSFPAVKCLSASVSVVRHLTLQEPEHPYLTTEDFLRLLFLFLSAVLMNQNVMMF